jgi:dipeptidyl-peptidase-4
MKRLLLIALLLIVGCSEKSEDKTTLVKKDEPIYGDQKKLPGKFIKTLMVAPTTGTGQEPTLTIDRIVSKPSITGTAPSSPSWSSDSRQLAFLWNDSGSPRREIWVVNGDGSGLRRLTSEIEGMGGVEMFVWTPDATELIYLRSGDVWRMSFTNGDGERLTENGGDKSDLAVSPDGFFASFLQNGDLWLFNLRTSALIQATEVSVPSISSVPLGRYNRPDVEIGPYVWGGPTYAWSPNSKTIAVHYVDRRNLRTVPFPYYLGKETLVNNLRRGYPGDPNEQRTIGFYGVESGNLTLLDLPDPTANRVVAFSWSPNGTLLLDRESDTAVDRWLHTVDPVDGRMEQIWHDHRETRVYTSIASAWHSDGVRVVFLSDLGDRYGLYLLTPGDETPALLTNKSFDVTGKPLVVSSASLIFFQSNEPSPYERQVFRIPDEGGTATRVTTLPGQHRPYPSPDGTRLALLHNSDLSPPDLYLMDTQNDLPEDRVTTSPTPEFMRRSWAQARYATFPSRIDNYTLHARILEPADLKPGKRYPVIFGPVYSNTVRNRWAGTISLMQQLLVERGYIVVQVDVRGSTGYGRAFREEFLTDFGGRDIEDLESAVNYLSALPYVDPERVGIWGSSYGGTLTIYSLFKKPGLYKAGVAGAAAVDPYFFGSDDVAIVRRPQSHPKAFTRGAAQYADNLEDHLLIIHGMQDDVVPFKTTVVLAEELIRLGKDFDFAFAPGATHGWTRSTHYARYLFGKLVGHFDRYLEPGSQ